MRILLAKLNFIKITFQMNKEKEATVFRAAEENAFERLSTCVENQISFR